tara:strand:+ start:608 stop:1585 length:978 start_codon:yes stop_codon:yes gene_type:complete
MLTDLCCGVGGFSQGAKKHLVLGVAVDNDEEILRIYRRNHPSATAIEADATTLRFAAGPGVHVHASFPCQALSVARASPEKTEVEEALRRIRRFVVTCSTGGQVHSFSLETVVTPTTVALAQELASNMQAVGYLVVDMKHWGVPSARKRLLITTRMLANALRREDTLPLVGAKEAFAHAGLEVPLGTQWLKNHRGKDRDTLTRFIDPSVTITSTALAFADRHGRTLRMLSPTESAVLMGFDKRYILPTRQRAAQLAIGNAVPPPFAERVAKWAQLAMRAKPMAPAALALPTVPSPPCPIEAIDRAIASLQRERDALLRKRALESL